MAGETNQQTQQNQNNNQNNSENNAPDYANLWANPKSDAPSAPAAAQPSQPAANPNDLFAQHIESLQLTKGIDFNKIMQDMNAGNSASLASAFNSLGANSYRAGIADAQRLMQTKIDEAVNKAVNKSDGNYKSDMLTQRMHDTLKFTSAPEIEPMAKAVLAKFVEKGMTHDKAIEETGKFFNHLGSRVASVAEAPSGQPGLSNYNKSQQQITDWEDVFTAITQQ